MRQRVDLGGKERQRVVLANKRRFRMDLVGEGRQRMDPDGRRGFRRFGCQKRWSGSNRFVGGRFGGSGGFGGGVGGGFGGGFSGGGGTRLGDREKKTTPLTTIKRGLGRRKILVGNCLVRGKRKIL
ncbi:OLC1v1008976C1 [Oldenlandia corymbosa var. corymbosa]|uniref:OLC1v1008976C1 n=1 Tax=Oldenlandia corymbosa var. corymbosa TaxID=529605 RepID=A0AAV1DQ91_OLDCO|nr:OLC1v1008976C1 [Oldenlandia corymbosa var. corymbosa]